MNKKTALLTALFMLLLTPSQVVAQQRKSTTTKSDIPQAVHPTIGTSATSTDGELTITLIAKKQNFGGKEPNTQDTDIHSPKSMPFSWQ